MKKFIQILNLIVLINYFSSTYGQIPNLGTASSFALFTNVGAFDNLGASQVIGDIGSNTANTTGFPPGILSGNVHDIDPISVQAALDVSSAYAFLDGLTCGQVLGTTLGNSQTLTPDIYCLGGSSTLNADLILDAQGDANAVFIFQIDGAFATNAFSNVILINNASINNIFWQVNGQFTLGNNSVFNGTAVITGAIILLDQAILFGRALTTAGAISLNNNYVELNNLPLSIEIVSFSGKNETNLSNKLEWVTNSNLQVNFFTIEKSLNKVDFETIGESIFQIDNCNYSFFDSLVSNTQNYYRLKYMNYNNEFQFSNLILINSYNTYSLISMYPNPCKEKLYIDFIEFEEVEKYNLKFYNNLGKEFCSNILSQSKNEILTSNWSKGLYFYILSNKNILLKTGKIVVE